MIPDSTASLVAFLLLLAPGIVWELLRARHVPSVKETTLIEVCRVVLVSLIATTLAAISLLWMWLPGYTNVITQSTQNIEAQVQLVGMAVATAALACGYAILASIIRWPGQPPIDGARVWHRAFVEWRHLPSPDGKRVQPTSPHLIVELQDGTVWKGAYGADDSDPEDDHRNLALKHPLSRKRPGETGFTEKTAGAVVLPEREIRSVQVLYLGEPAERRQSGGWGALSLILMGALAAQAWHGRRNEGSGEH